jgi:hypothetical protein
VKRTTTALALALCLTGLAVVPTAPAQAADLTSDASSDSFSNAADKKRNYGKRDAIAVDNRRGRYKRGYLKFRVPAVASDHSLESARLLLHPLRSSAHDVNVVRTGNAWHEDRLTWHTRPAGRGFLGSSNALRDGVTEVVDLDITSLRPGETLTLRLGTSAPVRLRFASSEARTAEHRPQLQVTARPESSTPESPTDPPTDPTPEPPDADTGFPGLGPFPAKRIGMSAPAYLWDQRIDEVGPSGVTARRIFADLTPTGTDQLNLVREAVADGMLPVISYKVPDPAVLAAGGYDSWLANLRGQLSGLDADVTATFWHEPYGDMDPATFRAASLAFLEGVDAPDIAVGPILNGWLLDRKVSIFASFTDATLLEKWEFVAVDSYQSGTPTAPGPAMPARAIPLLERWMDSMGHPDKPLGVGEYNGFTAEAVAEAGETVLSTPEVWFAAAWNSTAGNHIPLADDRLTAFQRTKSDLRAVR